MEFNVIIEPSANKDLRGILKYISKTLKEPQIAKRIYSSIKSEVMTLNQMPYRHPVVSEEPYTTMGVRRIPVENYTTFYIACEETHTVHILRILYSRREWQNLL